MSHAEKAVGGPVLTKPFKILLAIFGITLVLIAWRFFVGLGPATGLNDGFPWGLWKILNVIAGTALASGGYAVALLVYVLNRGKYHSLVRLAILTSALGYTVGCFALAVDVGRPWNLWKVILFVPSWNVHSALLEVAVCITAYLGVLWLETSPIFLETWAKSPHPLLSRYSAKATKLVEKSMVFILAFGVLLPSMHQSSLGSLMLLAGRKVDALWQTPLIPLLFLLVCITMGYATVIFASTLSSLAYRRPKETRMLGALSGVMAIVLLIFLGLRFADLAVRGQLGRAFSFTSYSPLFLIETALLAAGALLLLSKSRRTEPGYLFRAAMLIMTGGVLYRLDASLIAFNPGPGWAYFPSVTEIVITVGFIALEVLAYLLIVKRFPVLSGAPPALAGQVR